MLNGWASKFWQEEFATSRYVIVSLSFHTFLGDYLWEIEDEFFSCVCVLPSVIGERSYMVGIDPLIVLVFVTLAGKLHVKSWFLKFPSFLFVL